MSDEQKLTFTLGTRREQRAEPDVVQAQAVDDSYLRMAAEMTDAERSERRAHTTARRVRLAARNDR